jgi:uncharacterized membrane protein YdjX (TVP38/TMEM64 family)
VSAVRLVPRLALALLLAGLVTAAALNREQIDPAVLDAWIAGLGSWAPVGYVAVYALATIAFVPGTIFGLAGGALFGPVWGTVCNLVGATAGATLAFLVARYLAADWIARKAGGRLGRLIAGVEAEGWRFVAFVRLVPLFPFNLSNYALGLTRIPLGHYVLASLVCMAPGTVAYTWLGYAGREALAGDAAAVRYGLLGLGLLVAIAFLPRLLRGVRGAPAWIDPRELERRRRAGAQQAPRGGAGRPGERREARGGLLPAAAARGQERRGPAEPGRAAEGRAQAPYELERRRGVAVGELQ